MEIAKRRGWTVVGVYPDNDESASRYSKKGPRKNCNRLLADIEVGRIDAVVVWMEDRLQRQVIELAHFLQLCEKHGVKRFASTGGEFDLSDPGQRTLLYMKAAMAEAEVDTLSKHVRRKHQEKIEKGEHAGGGRRALGEARTPNGKRQTATKEQAAAERDLIRELSDD